MPEGYRVWSCDALDGCGKQFAGYGSGDHICPYCDHTATGRPMTQQERIDHAFPLTDE